MYKSELCENTEVHSRRPKRSGKHRFYCKQKQEIQTYNSILNRFIQRGVIFIRGVRPDRHGDLPFHRNVLRYRHVRQACELSKW